MQDHSKKIIMHYNASQKNICAKSETSFP